MKGRKTGIFTSWKKCEEQVKGFKGAIYKSFETREAAEAALELIEHNDRTSNDRTSEPRKKPTQHKPSIASAASAHSSFLPPTLTSQFIPDSLCVDAACSGNPGAVEYRGVYTATGEVVFHKRPIPYGTNNLGEFLAIVHALAYLKQHSRDIPIYSDSATAILWVKQKRVRTTLRQDAGSKEIFELVERAINWLESNEYKNPILKWDTKNWGEIPADFGRK